MKFIGEIPVKNEGAETRSRQGVLLEHDGGLTPVLGKREGSTGQEELQIAGQF